MPERMRRVPAPVLALALALAPGSTWALGLGGIRSDSALNEPFLGRIELNGIAPEELDAVQVTLASEAEFTKIGSPRPHFLSRLTFTPEVSPEGRLQIRVTSPEPIREPYLDFLVEVTWTQGRLVKGYTVLLDPPTTLNRPPPTVKTAQVTAPEVQASRPSEAPLRPGAGAPPSRLSGAAAPPVASTGPILAEAGRPAAGAGPNSAPPPPTFGPPPPGYPLRYGPVPSGAALSTLARRMAPPDASREQTALAIFRANPHAFSGGDINRLKAGVRLEIPYPELIFAHDAKTARKLYLAAQKGQPLPPLPVPAPGAPGVVPISESDRLEIATRHPAAEVGKGSLPVAATPSPSTTMATALPSTATSEGPLGLDLALVEREILLVREMAETGRQETTELRGRIDRLEAHLGDIKRLLELSNAQLAELQRLGGEGVRALTAPAVVAEPGPLEARVPENGETTPSEPVASEPGPQVTRVSEAGETAAPAPVLATGQGVQESPPAPTRPAESPAPPAATESPLPPAPAEPPALPVAAESVTPPVDQPAQRAKEPAKPAPPPPPPPPEPSLFEDLSGWPLAVGGPLLVLLLGLLILVRRQNQVKPIPELAPKSPQALAPAFGEGQPTSPSIAPTTVPLAATDSAELSGKLGGLKHQFSRWRTRNAEWLAGSGKLKQRFSLRRTSSAESPAKVGWLKRQLSRDRTTSTELPAKAGWLHQQLVMWRPRKAEPSPTAGWREQLSQLGIRFRKVPQSVSSPVEAPFPVAQPAPVAPVPQQTPAALVGLVGPRPLQPVPAQGAESAQVEEQPLVIPVAVEASHLEPEKEAQEALSLPPTPGPSAVGGRPSESPVNPAEPLPLDLEIASEEAVLAALDQTLREPEPTPPASPLLQPPLGELDLGNVLELSLPASTSAGSGLPPQPSTEVPELDLSDLEGLDLGDALGLTPTPPSSAAAAVTAPSGESGADLGLELDLSDILDLDLDLSVLSAPETSPTESAASAFTADIAPAASPGGAEDRGSLGLSAGPESAAQRGAALEAGSHPLRSPLELAGEAGTDSHPPEPIAETLQSCSLPTEETSAADRTGSTMDFDLETEPWDEVGIKLDLARAYLQMDDPEAARAILVEILSEGTEEQIAQTKALLARLD